MNPDAGFAEKFEAVMTDMMSGRHTSQITPDDPGLYREPTDHEATDDNPTNDF